MAIPKRKMNDLIVTPPTKRMKTMPPIKKTRRLRFSEVSNLFITEPKTVEDVQNSWYNRNELAQFKADVHIASKALRNTRTALAMKHIARSAAQRSPQADIHLEGREVVRGLEHLVAPAIAKHLLDRRRITIANVLEEQRSQKLSGRGAIDPLSIARASERSSAFAQEWCARITHLQHP